MVRPKKKLGQHFLADKNIAERIVQSLSAYAERQIVLEIGPGTGVLTHFLTMRTDIDLYVIEIDPESIAYLSEYYPELESRIIAGDIIDFDIRSKFNSRISVIGNFPYNISSQIFFKVLEHRDIVEEVICMLQKEVADRIASPHGSKVYGILSVLLQTFYTIEFLFKVSPGVFIPPPKVMSGVIRLRRNDRVTLPCNEDLFIKVVKQGFNNRRKTLRNALKNLNLPPAISAMPLLDKRAEQLPVEDFIHLTSKIEEHRAVR